MLEGGRRQLDDFRKAETAAISAAAILHRPPQPLIDGDEISRRPRAGAIDQDGIAGVGQPGTEQILGMINCQGVGISTDPVVGRAEKVIQPVMPGDGRVAQFESREQRNLALPFVGKADTFVERDVAMS